MTAPHSGIRREIEMISFLRISDATFRELARDLRLLTMTEDLPKPIERMALWCARKCEQQIRKPNGTNV
jgi:hypothetical protein